MKRILFVLAALSLFFCPPVDAYTGYQDPGGGGSGGGGSLNNIVEDTTPQLGGNLDANGKDITGVADFEAVTVTTTAADGSRRLKLGNNTTRAPEAGAYELYPEGGEWKAAENGSEYQIILDEYYFKSPDGGDCDALNQYFDTCLDTTLKAAVLYDENGSIQWVGSKKIKHYRFSVQDPENLNTHAARTTKSVVMAPFDNSFGAVITQITAHSDTDDYAFNLFSCGSATDCGTANDVLIDLVTCATNGTSTFYDTQTTISSATVSAAIPIIFEHSSGTAETVMVDVYYYLNGNVD